MSGLPTDPADVIERLAELDERAKEAQRRADDEHWAFMAALSEAMARKDLNKTRLAERLDRARNGLDVIVARWRKRCAEDERVKSRAS